MKLKQYVWELTPPFLKRPLRTRHEVKELRRIETFYCDLKYLKSIDDVIVNELFISREIDLEWGDLHNRIETFDIPDGTGGVNPGDRKAIYYLISYFNSSSVLEIGTHIGASTLHIASALYVNQTSKDGKQAHLVSVDISDVNDPVSKPWLKHGTKHSPSEMVSRMDYGDFVEFVTDTSLNYFSECDQKFDFIFIDGNHSAKVVYQEVPAALNLLNDNGVVLLHDYFPDLKPLWSNGALIPGPLLATERLKDEGANLVVVPLGELPWPTKLESNITSLALVLKSGQ